MTKLLRHKKTSLFLAGAAASFLWMSVLPSQASDDDDVFQKALNYVFTGKINPTNAPEILNPKSCVVVVTDPQSKRYIRYYLSRFRMDVANINKTYSGSRTLYNLDVRGDDNIVEYLGPDKSTVLYGNKAAQISLPGDINQTNRALQLIAEHCKADEPKVPF